MRCSTPIETQRECCDDLEQAVNRQLGWRPGDVQSTTNNHTALWQTMIAHQKTQQRNQPWTRTKVGQDDDLQNDNESFETCPAVPAIKTEQDPRTNVRHGINTCQQQNATYVCGEYAWQTNMWPKACKTRDTTTPNKQIHQNTIWETTWHGNNLNDQQKQTTQNKHIYANR